MNRRHITALLGGLLVTAWAFQARAEVKENPYQIIIDRNPFGLRPVPPPQETKVDNTPPPPPPLGVAMTGITTLLGPAKVFLEFTDPQTKKVERPSALLEGEAFKAITVVSIDTENNRVKIKNGDTESWLDFEKNGVKPAGGGAAAPVPHPGFPGGVPPAPAAAAAVPTPAGAVPAPISGRGGLVGGTTTPAPGVGAVSSLGAGGLPPRTVRTDGAGLIGGSGVNPNPVPSAPATAPSMTPDQAQAIIEARRLQLQQMNDSRANILPPTALGNQLKNMTPQPQGR